MRGSNSKEGAGEGSLVFHRTGGGVGRLDSVEARSKKGAVSGPV